MLTCLIHVLYESVRNFFTSSRLCFCYCDKHELLYKHYWIILSSKHKLLRIQYFQEEDAWLLIGRAPLNCPFWGPLCNNFGTSIFVKKIKRTSIKHYLFYNDYETSYTTYIKHSRWYRCLRSDGLCVGGNRSAKRKPTRLTWWPHAHLTCRRRVSYPGRSGERRVR